MKIGSRSQIIFISLFLTGVTLCNASTGLRKLWKYYGPKPLCWAKPACLAFLHPILLSRVAYWALRDALINKKKCHKIYKVLLFFFKHNNIPALICAANFRNLANYFFKKSIISIQRRNLQKLKNNLKNHHVSTYCPGK